MKIPLKKLRDSKNITQAELARILQVTPAAVGLWEQGRRLPDYGSLIKIAAYFGVTTDFLLGKDMYEEPSLQKPEPPAFAKEEVRLIDKYRQLTTRNKERLNDLLSTFLIAQKATPMRRTIVQPSLF